ncbi:S1C family serine protease [Aeoliella mucimassa]|uniref:Serine protease HtrA n=1 Tax=Aeoliella mucimassa TaxID=2527972 RepID=A0A518AMJ4_9BACT|nr:trypsin-like peptidase domain-containing protein [Aeoliella mucimassa]QDU55954.1 Putative serine protease HtrA [Aeoliella mucimassa]
MHFVPHSLRYVLCSLVVLVMVESAPLAQGQLAALEAPPGVNADSEREQAYDQLARDVAALDRELGIIKRVVKLVTPSVVHIEASPVREARGRSDVQEAGSGVVVTLNGKPYVLTNRHVIKNSSEALINVHFADGTNLHPNRIWSDSQTDVAVMRIADPNLVAARMGNSDTIDIGEQVLAVGSPFGLSQSVTRGIISAKGRYNLDLGDGDVRLQNFLQTDAAINPGNSGGPLINLRGEVVGINTAIASNSGGNEGIGFSIPINVVTRIAKDLITNGQVKHGFLGVTLDSLFDERRAQALGLTVLSGTRIKAVEPNSPADLARLKENDVILLYNGVRVEDMDHLISLVGLTEIGREVPLIVFRDRQAMKIDVKIATHKKSNGK